MLLHAATVFLSAFLLFLVQPLLADTDGAVGRAYGTLGGSGLMSKLKSAAGMADRVTFVIDEKGRIAHVIDKPQVGRHAEEVLALL